MQTVFRLLSLRYLLQRWDRSALIVASISLGVATLVSTRILNECIETAANQSATPLGIGDLYITNGELGVNRPIADEVRAARLDGIESVQPIVVDRVYLPGQDNRATVLIGAEIAKHQLAGGDVVDAVSGANPLKISITKGDFNMLAAAFATHRIVISRPLYVEWLARKKTKDEPFVLRYGSRMLDCQPVGVLECGDDSPLKALGPNVVGMEIVQAAKFLRPSPLPEVAALVGASASPDAWDEHHPPRVNRIDILLKPGADRASVQASLEAIVGERASVRTPKDQDQNTQDIIGGIQLGFTLCSIGAMVVGLFLVYNSLAVTVAERRHDIGILRSIGATRMQIVLMFAIAAFFLGFVGSLLGIPLGYILSQIALHLIRNDLARMTVGGEVPLSMPNPATLLLAFAAGVGTAVFAALVPSLQALARHRKQTGALKLDAIKLSHHGSRANVTASLLKVVQADHYIVSTNGAIFHHPDDEAISRVIVHGGRQPRLWFNFDNERSRRWAEPALRSEYGYDVILPEGGHSGLTLLIGLHADSNRTAAV